MAADPSGWGIKEFLGGLVALLLRFFAYLGWKTDGKDKMEGDVKEDEKNRQKEVKFGEDSDAVEDETREIKEKNKGPRAEG